MLLLRELWFLPARFLSLSTQFVCILDNLPPVLLSLVELLVIIERSLDDFEPEKQAMRFGNAAFRTWFEIHTRKEFIVQNFTRYTTYLVQNVEIFVQDFLSQFMETVKIEEISKGTFYTF